MNNTTINRDEALRKLALAEDELERAEERCAALRERLKQTDKSGVGVRVLYDYDLKWIVETMNDGEWEVSSQHGRFSNAVSQARNLARELNCGVDIDSYKPKRSKAAVKAKQ